MKEKLEKEKCFLIDFKNMGMVDKWKLVYFKEIGRIAQSLNTPIQYSDDA